MMYSVSTKKVNINAPEPSQREKIAQIRSGKQFKRAKSGLQRRSVVVQGNDGSKIVKNQTEQDFEESGVTKKKRNYIMYESKLSTEKNTQIQSFKKKKPARKPSPRVEERIVIQKKRKDYLDNYQYHESKVLNNPDPKYQGEVKHARLGDVVGGSKETTIQQITRYSTCTFQPKHEPTKYSTKTTIIKTPYKPQQTPYKPLRTPYQPAQTPYKPIQTTTTTSTTTHKRIQTPYVTLTKPYESITTSTVPYVPPVLPVLPELPSYQTIQTSYVSSSKPLYEPLVTPYKPLNKPSRPVKTPYNELRQFNTEIFKVNTNSRSGAKTPAVKTQPSYDVNRTINNNYDYSSKTFHIKKPNNVITRRTENVIKNRLKTPTYSTKREVTTSNSYRKRGQPIPQNLYQNSYQTNTNKSTVSKVFTTNLSEYEPKSSRFDNDAYGTRTITTVSRLSKKIEDDFDGNNLSNRFNEIESSYNLGSRPNTNSSYMVKIERRTEVVDDGSYGKGPSIRNKYKRKK